MRRCVSRAQLSKLSWSSLLLLNRLRIWGEWENVVVVILSRFVGRIVSYRFFAEHARISEGIFFSSIQYAITIKCLVLVCVCNAFHVQLTTLLRYFWLLYIWFYGLFWNVHDNLLHARYGCCAVTDGGRLPYGVARAFFLNATKSC